MLSQLKFSAVTAALVLGGANARRYLDDKEELGHKQLTKPTEDYTEAVDEPFSPLVEAADCPLMCLFKETNSVNSFCWKT